MGSVRLPIVKTMKLFPLVLAPSAHAFFGIPQYTGIGVGEVNGPDTHSHSNACNILPTDPKCSDCEKVGAACLDEANLAFCEKLGFNSMLNKCKLVGPPSKFTAAPKKPKRPKAPKKAKKPKKAKPTCSTAEPTTCDGCLKMKGKCRKPFKDTCKALCTTKCENPPKSCDECKATLTSACEKDRKVKMACKKMCKPPKTPKKQQRFFALR